MSKLVVVFTVILGAVFVGIFMHYELVSYIIQIVRETDKLNIFIVCSLLGYEDKEEEPEGYPSHCPICKNEVIRVEHRCFCENVECPLICLTYTGRWLIDPILLEEWKSKNFDEFDSIISKVYSNQYLEPPILRIKAQLLKKP